MGGLIDQDGQIMHSLHHGSAASIDKLWKHDVDHFVMFF